MLCTRADGNGGGGSQLQGSLPPRTSEPPPSRLAQPANGAATCCTHCSSTHTSAKWCRHPASKQTLCKACYNWALGNGGQLPELSPSLQARRAEACSAALQRRLLQSRPQPRQQQQPREQLQFSEGAGSRGHVDDEAEPPEAAAAAQDSPQGQQQRGEAPPPQSHSKVCCHCGTTASSHWRRHLVTGDPMCGRCRGHWEQHGHLPDLDARCERCDATSPGPSPGMSWRRGEATGGRRFCSP